MPVRKAKKRFDGIVISWNHETNSYNLFFNDEFIGDFDSKSDVVLFLLETVKRLDFKFIGRCENDNLDYYNSLWNEIERKRENNESAKEEVKAFREQLNRDREGICING